jgi:spore protease
MIRTDLAAEAAELYKESNPGAPDGVISDEYTREGFGVTKVTITNENGAAAIGKPCGSYITVDLDGLMRREENAFPRACQAIADELRPLLPSDAKAPVLVAGIGNENITPDAIGPVTARNTMATRHMVTRMPEYFGGFRPVAAVSPGVLGITGIETAEILRGICENVRPSAMVVVDALASRRMARVCRTVQIADTGLAPGSGMGGDSRPVNSETFGIPVIAVGVPTVVDSLTLTLDTLHDSGITDIDEDTLRGASGGMIVTPKDIDAQVADVSKLLGYALNMALHEGITIEDIDMYLS